jgi:hypothetical protein
MEPDLRLRVLLENIFYIRLHEVIMKENCPYAIKEETGNRGRSPTGSF